MLLSFMMLSVLKSDRTGASKSPCLAIFLNERNSRLNLANERVLHIAEVVYGQGLFYLAAQMSDIWGG